ncbi:MAG: tripartite tricarboxylate transporter substrate binding protein [Pseudomonadota bacterium]
MLGRFAARALKPLGAAGAAATAFALATAPAMAGETGWKPNKPVEMVVMAGQGGGADRLARLFQQIIQKNRLSPMPVLPVNKGGGSGAEALRYLKDKSGDAHTIMATLNSYYTTPIRQDIGVDIEEFTPLARMAVDTFVLWVNADSGITTLEEYVAAVKAEGGAWKMGGTGSGQEDSLVTQMLQEEFGLDITYVPFKGGGAVAKNLVGGHINSSVNNPSEAIAFYEAGKLTPIAAFTAERIPALADVPTMTELGHELTYAMQRSFVGPADMPAGAVAFYRDMFAQLAENEQWVEYANAKALETNLLTGDALQAYFLEERAAHAALLGGS